MSIFEHEETGEAWIATAHNERRAAWSQEAVEAFREVCPGAMDETALSDLVASMRPSRSALARRARV